MDNNLFVEENIYKKTQKKQSVNSANYLMPSTCESKVAATPSSSLQPYRRPSIFDFVDFVNDETNAESEQNVYSYSTSSNNINVDVNNNTIMSKEKQQQQIPMFHIEAFQENESGEQTIQIIENEDDEDLCKSE